MCHPTIPRRMIVTSGPGSRLSSPLPARPVPRNNRAGVLRGPCPSFHPYSPTAQKVRVLGSPRARTRIAPAQMAQDRLDKPPGIGPGPTPCYTVGWICSKERRPSGPPCPAESAPGRLRSLQNTNRTELEFHARLAEETLGTRKTLAALLKPSCTNVRCDRCSPKLVRRRSLKFAFSGVSAVRKSHTIIAAPVCLWLIPPYTSCSGAVLCRAAVVPGAPPQHLEPLSQAPDEVRLRCLVLIVQLVGILP
jgi:hypothetical protein